MTPIDRMGLEIDVVGVSELAGDRALERFETGVGEAHKKAEDAKRMVAPVTSTVDTKN